VFKQKLNSGNLGKHLSGAFPLQNSLKLVGDLVQYFQLCFEIYHYEDPKKSNTGWKLMKQINLLSMLMMLDY
jgi:hypothetical protein